MSKSPWDEDWTSGRLTKDNIQQNLQLTGDQFPGLAAIYKFSKYETSLFVCPAELCWIRNYGIVVSSKEADSPYLRVSWIQCGERPWTDSNETTEVSV